MHVKSVITKRPKRPTLYTAILRENMDKLHSLIVRTVIIKAEENPF